MKKYFLLLFFGFGCSVFSFSNAQSWLWGKQGTSGNNTTEGYAVAVDKDDNALLTGGYFDSLTFGPYILTTNLDGAFLAKYDSSGNLQWAIQPRATAFCEGMAVTSDASNNIYLTGNFQDSLICGAYKLSTGVNTAPFLAKYSSNGSVIWAKQGLLSASGSSFCVSVTTDLAGNIYITGSFLDSLTFGTYKLATHIPFSREVFIAKYDASGNVLWAKQSYSRLYSQGQSVATDALGNAYITGSFNDTLIFGSYSFFAGEGYDIFITKYDSSGNILWANQTVAPSSNCQASGLSVITDASNNAYLTGYFTDTISFGSFTLHNAHKNKDAIFLAKYNSIGNIVWAESASSFNNYNWQGYSLAIDRKKYLYLAGGTNHNDSIIFGIDTFHVAIATDQAIVVKFDSNGNVLCGSIIGSGGDDQNGIAADPSGKYIFLGGDLESRLIFGSDSIGPLYAGEYPFVARWYGDCNNIETSIKNIPSEQKQINIYPNPCTNILNIDLGIPLIPNSQFLITITDITGRVLLTDHCQLTTDHTSIDVSPLSTGMYFIRINSGSGTEVRKFIKE